MTFLDLVRQRRSVRKFLDRPVDRAAVLTCLEAARLAPSASNSQPWKFIVVDDRTLIAELCRVAFTGIYSFNSFCETAPVLVVIVSERSKSHARLGQQIRNTRYYLIDIGIAGEHIALQARELGLGTCWIGWFNEKAVKRVLGVPKGKKIDVLIAMGHADPEVVRSEQKRHPMEEIVSFNRY